MSEELKDLETLRPAKKPIAIGGKRFYPEEISFDACLDIMEEMQKLNDQGGIRPREQMKAFEPIMDKIMMEQDKTVNAEWIQKNVTGIRRFKFLIRLIAVVGELMEDAAEGEDSKKKL